MSNVGRVILFAVVGAAIVFVIDLAPPEASGLAFVAVLGLAFVGGLLATSRIEIVALVIGSVVGGLLSAFIQLGSPGGPSSGESALTGLIFVAVVMWVVGSYGFGMRSRFAGASAAPVRGRGATVGQAPATPTTRELRPNTLSIDLVPNRLNALGTGKAAGQAPRPRQVGSARR